MIPLPLDEVERIAPGRLERAPRAERATGVTIDSRRTEPGDLFVGIGRGAEFAGEALAAGAGDERKPDRPSQCRRPHRSFHRH